MSGFDVIFQPNRRLLRHSTNRVVGRVARRAAPQLLIVGAVAAFLHYQAIQWEEAWLSAYAWLTTGTILANTLQVFHLYRKSHELTRQNLARLEQPDLRVVATDKSLTLESEEGRFEFNWHAFVDFERTKLAWLVYISPTQCIPIPLGSLSDEQSAFLQQKLRYRGRPRCKKCGYDLRGNPDAPCPECGHELTAAKSTA